MNGDIKVSARDHDGDGIPDEYEIRVKIGRVALAAVASAVATISYWFL